MKAIIGIYEVTRNQKSSYTLRYIHLPHTLYSYNMAA